MHFRLDHKAPLLSIRNLERKVQPLDRIIRTLMAQISVVKNGCPFIDMGAFWFVSFTQGYVSLCIKSKLILSLIRSLAAAPLS